MGKITQPFSRKYEDSCWFWVYQSTGWKFVIWGKLPIHSTNKSCWVVSLSRTLLLILKLNKSNHPRMKLGREKLLKHSEEISALHPRAGGFSLPLAIGQSYMITSNVDWKRDWWRRRSELSKFFPQKYMITKIIANLYDFNWMTKQHMKQRGWNIDGHNSIKMKKSWTPEKSTWEIPSWIECSSWENDQIWIVTISGKSCPNSNSWKFQYLTRNPLQLRFDSKLIVLGVAYTSFSR